MIDLLKFLDAPWEVARQSLREDLEHLEAALNLQSAMLAATPPGSGFSGILPASSFPALVGDVTTAAGSVVTAIGNAKVTNAMLAGGIDLATKVTGILPATSHPALGGDVTVPAGSVVTTIGAGKVTNAMLAGGIDLATKVTGVLPATSHPAHTGDVTTVAGALATTIGAGKVTNAMLAGGIAASKLIGTDITTVGTITVGQWNAGPVQVHGYVTVVGSVPAPFATLLEADGTFNWLSFNGVMSTTLGVAMRVDPVGGVMYFLTPTGGGYIWRVNNVAKLSVDAAGITFGGYTATSFVAGDKYLVIDASGNVHRSAIGPAS